MDIPEEVRTDIVGTLAYYYDIDESAAERMLIDLDYFVTTEAAEEWLKKEVL